MKVLGKLRTFIYLIGCRARDLPVSSLLPQTLLCAPFYLEHYNYDGGYSTGFIDRTSRISNYIKMKLCSPTVDKPNVGVGVAVMSRYTDNQFLQESYSNGTIWSFGMIIGGFTQAYFGDDVIVIPEYRCNILF